MGYKQRISWAEDKKAIRIWGLNAELTGNIKKSAGAFICNSADPDTMFEITAFYSRFVPVFRRFPSKNDQGIMIVRALSVKKQV